MGRDQAMNALNSCDGNVKYAAGLLCLNYARRDAMPDDESKQIGIYASYAHNDVHIKNGDYKFMRPQTNCRRLDILGLLKIIELTRDKSNAFITNKMDEEKNK